MGVHETKDLCWNCKNYSAEGLKKCSKCAVAGYCSKTCQVNAWKGGHKQKCADLFCRNEVLRNGLQTIDDAHKSNEYEMELNLASDLKVLEAFCGTSGCDWGIVSGPLPSVVRNDFMRTFYVNLRSVLRGERWFYGKQDTVEWRKSPDTDLDDNREEAYFNDLLLTLCDTVGDSMSEHPRALRLQSEYGVAMPAHAFRQKYALRMLERRFDSSASADVGRLRRDTVNRLLHLFRETCHT